ncbi:MAG: ABC transporter ATP-binding protein [Bacteroidota bacterium]
MIEVQHLQKSFGTHTAVNDVSFSVRKGEFYSLLGPNGAGKTTTISMLSSLLKCDKGELTVNGTSVTQSPEEVKKNIGVVPQEISLYDDFSALDNLYFWGSLYRVQKNDLKKRAESLLTDFGLLERAKDKVKTYSGGMKRRINIACALLHNPPVVFMDEPTVGIDPQSRNNIYEAIDKMKKEGKTILYTTHYMEEAERFSDRIGIMDNGKIIAEGTLEDLKKTGNVRETISLECASTPSKKDFLSEFDFSVNENILRFTVDSVKKDLPKILGKCFENGVDVTHIDISRSNLESVFLQLTGKKLRD